MVDGASVILLAVKLLFIFQLKHFLADYILQNKYMLGKFKPDWSFVGPLLSHSAVHGLFTLVVCVWLGLYELWWLALIDVVLHFVMDRVKAGPKYLGRFKALSGKEFIMIEQDRHMCKLLGENTLELDELIKHNTYFWFSLGFDQMFHHLTHYAFICIILIKLLGI